MGSLLCRVTRALSLALAASLVTVIPGEAAAQDTTKTVRIGLEYNTANKPGVLVLPIEGTSGDSIRKILMRDFDYGDRFEVITLDDEQAKAFVPAAGGNYDFATLAKLNVSLLVVPTLTGSNLDVRSFDVGKQKLYRERAFAISGARLGPEWRMSVHGIADEIENWVFGTRGVAQTRILFDRGRNDGRVYIIDSDGANERPVLAAGKCMSAAWHPNGKSFAASCQSTDGTGWRIRVQDFTSSSPRFMHATGNTNTAPTFSPDGASILYSASDEGGNTDLVMAAIGKGSSSRSITARRSGINTSAAFHPDGSLITFTTDRLGSPDIYISNVDGTNAEQLSELEVGERTQRTNPDWSPDGRAIAFQAQMGGGFQLVMVTLRDKVAKYLTSEGRNQEPSWAPDSRHVVFASSRSGPMQLWVLDVESGRVRQLTRGGANARLPAWSPWLVSAEK